MDDSRLIPVIQRQIPTWNELADVYMYEQVVLKNGIRVFGGITNVNERKRKTCTIASNLEYDYSLDFEIEKKLNNSKINVLFTH